jgi:hypothetical protein
MAEVAGNDLGGRIYTPAEQNLIYAVALELKRRDQKTQPVYGPGMVPKGMTPLTPKDYMFLYTKAAAIVYETAKTLESFRGHPLLLPKSVGEWLLIITGRAFNEAIGLQTSECRQPLIGELNDQDQKIIDSRHEVLRLEPGDEGTTAGGK